jgi:hypothetical protein
LKSVHPAAPPDHPAIFPDHRAAPPDRLAKFPGDPAKFPDHLAKVPDHPAKLISHPAKFPDGLAKRTDHPEPATGHLDLPPNHVCKSLKSRRLCEINPASRCLGGGFAQKPRLMQAWGGVIPKGSKHSARHRSLAARAVSHLRLSGCLESPARCNKTPRRCDR